MSNPTSNYSFQMPISSDLVTDLPADFEVFGQAVDTQMKTNADAAIAKSLVTTKGDLIAATGASTPARLGVGTDGQVLTADAASAAGVKWATSASGGMTLLSTTTLSGASTTISSISTAYNDLSVVIKELRPATDNTYLRFQVNSLTGTNYYSTGNLAGTAAFSAAAISLDTITGIDNGASTGLTVINVPNYANTTTWKIMPAYTMANDATTPTQVTFGYKYGFVNTTSAITSFTFFMNTGNFTSGTVLIYGVK